MKMAKNAAEISGKNVLFLCSSKPLAEMVRSNIGDAVIVKEIRSLFENVIRDFNAFAEPTYDGLSNNFMEESTKYDAIFVDEAQDFTTEWANIVRNLLVEKDTSRLGIFYDDVQVLREDSFGDGFGMAFEPGIGGISDFKFYTQRKYKAKR